MIEREALPWVVGAASVAAGGVIAFRLVESALVATPADPTPQQRREAFVRVSTDPQHGDGDADTALLLLDEARRRYERTQSSGDALEGKAASLLSIVSGASGAVGIFGLTKPETPLVTSPLTLDAVGAALAALSCALYLLRPKAFRAPDPSFFISGPVTDRDRRVGLSLELAEGYSKFEREYLYSLRSDRWVLLLGYLFIATAAAFVLVAAMTPHQAASSTPQHPAAHSSATHPQPVTKKVTRPH